MGANGNVSCELGVFPVGATVFTLTVMVDVAAGSGALANTVTAGAATPDPTPANSDIATTTVDGDGPTVLQVSSVADTGDGVLADGESTSVEITELLITFDEELQDPPGDGGSDDATNPANYLLIEAGTNGAIETAACGPAGGDDGTVAITGVTYDSGSSTATLVLGAPLAVGEYRLFACGSTSLLDLLGNPLQGGQDFALDFAIVVAASIIEVPTIGDVGRWLLIALLGLAGLAVLWRRGV
jgi:hypothetical protein